MRNVAARPTLVVFPTASLHPSTHFGALQGSSGPPLVDAVFFLVPVLDGPFDHMLDGGMRRTENVESGNVSGASEKYFQSSSLIFIDPTQIVNNSNRTKIFIRSLNRSFRFQSPSLSLYLAGSNTRVSKRSSRPPPPLQRIVPSPSACAAGRYTRTEGAITLERGVIPGTWKGPLYFERSESHVKTRCWPLSMGR
jgi:hypothetical protein